VSELVTLAWISMFSVWGGLLIMFGIWLLKQHMRQKYLFDRLKWNIKHKSSGTPPAPVKENTTLESIAKILPALKDLDPDLIQDLLERFGSGESLGSGEGGLEAILDNPVVQGFLEKLAEKKEQPEQPHAY